MALAGLLCWVIEAILIDWNCLSLFVLHTHVHQQVTTYQLALANCFGCVCYVIHGVKYIRVDLYQLLIYWNLEIPHFQIKKDNVCELLFVIMSCHFLFIKQQFVVFVLFFVVFLWGHDDEVLHVQFAQCILGVTWEENLRHLNKLARPWCTVWSVWGYWVSCPSICLGRSSSRPSQCSYNPFLPAQMTDPTQLSPFNAPEQQFPTLSLRLTQAPCKWNLYMLSNFSCHNQELPTVVEGWYTFVHQDNWFCLKHHLSVHHRAL